MTVWAPAVTAAGAPAVAGAGSLPAADAAVLAGAHPGASACALTELRLHPAAALRAQAKFAATLGGCPAIAEPMPPRAGGSAQDANAPPLRQVDIDPPARPAPLVQDPVPQRPVLMPPARPEAAPAERTPSRLAPRVDIPAAIDGAAVARRAVTAVGDPAQALPPGLTADVRPRLADRAVVARMHRS
ncbi:MAG: hypothetical protein NTV19_04645, partial [Burkholderiales bacterium]|nr:hypothetical protein [Burkholderiales bacterium]